MGGGLGIMLLFKGIIAIEIKLYVSCCGSGGVGMCWFMGGGLGCVL